LGVQGFELFETKNFKFLLNFIIEYYQIALLGLFVVFNESNKI